MAAYSEENCRREHERVDARFEKGEIRMGLHEAAINSHAEQLAIMRELAKQRDSIVWKILTPILTVASGIATAVFSAWILIQ
jgi:hypothetical protein